MARWINGSVTNRDGFTCHKRPPDVVYVADRRWINGSVTK
jgi:hypothetical protein